MIDYVILHIWFFMTHAVMVELHIRPIPVPHSSPQKIFLSLLLQMLIHIQ